MEQLAVGQYAPLAEGTYLEGLAYDFARDVIWYSDVIEGGIHGVRPDGSKYGTVCAGRMWTGGVMLNSDGAVLTTGQGGIMWEHPDTGKSGWLIEQIPGDPLDGVNEMWPDGQGGIFFGSNDIEYIIAAKDTRPTKIYRLTRDRELIMVADQIYFGNGLGFDEQRRRFYASDTFRTSWTWDVNDDLTFSNQRVFFEKGDCDGLAIEANGNVLITGFRSPGVIKRISPDGKELADLVTPPGSTTQIRFGGKDLRDYYIVVVPADGGDSLKEGKPLTGKSTLYRGRAETPGIAQKASDFKLD